MAAKAPEPDPRYELVLSEAIRAVSQQVTWLEQLRGRGATLLTATVVISGLIGGADLNRHKISALGIAALAAAGLAAVLTAVVLHPGYEWFFRNSPQSLIAIYLESDEEGFEPATLDKMRRDLALHMGKEVRVNDMKLEKLGWAITATAMCLAFVSVAWLIDLAGR